MQAAIVSALEQLGFYVERIQSGKHRVKRGFLHCASKGTPDLYVLRIGFREVKVPGEKLDAAQLAWHARARGQGENVETWWSVEEAVLEARSVLRAEAKFPVRHSPLLKCELHGLWDPTCGAKMCGGCAYTLAVEESKGELYAMHPRAARVYVDAIAMRGPLPEAKRCG